MALAKLTILNDRYVLRNTLGEPGLYDNTYLAWNLMKKETAVVIREYNPTFLMRRSNNGEKMIPKSGPAERLFEYGLNCFIREADATGLIQHPNVVHQLDYFRENGTAYSVSAYHPGATLAAVLQGQQGKLQERAAFAIIIPLLDGLIAGHRKGLIHGCLSPSQVFLTKSGRPMLLRFHVTQILLARRCGRASDISSPGFIAPELLLPEGKKGPWSDVYASGATLYSIITGKKPLPVMNRFKHDPLPDILHRETDISKGMKKVLNRAMMLDWNERPQTIQEFKQEILEQMPASSRPYTPAVELKSSEQENVKVKEKEVELQKAKNTAHDIAILSREALEKLPLKVKEPDPPIIPLSLEEVDSERAREWFPKVKTSDRTGDGIPFRKEPVVETNPMGPIAGELTYVSPKVKEMQVTAKEMPHQLHTSSLTQVFKSATVNRTRKLSITAIAACILVFAAAGIWNALEPGAASEMPSSVRAAGSSVAAPAASHASYALLLAEADSLQQLAVAYSQSGDSSMHARMLAEAYDAYEEILRENPGDSLAIAKMSQINAFRDAFERDETDIELTAHPELPVEALAYIERGDSLMTLGKFAEARSEFESVLALSPENEHAMTLLQQIDGELGEITRRQEFQSLLRQGEIFLRDASFQEAQAAFSKALELNPENKAVQIRLRNVEELIERGVESTEQFNELKKQGDSLFSLNSFSSALINYESAQLLHPEDQYIAEQIKAVKDSLKKIEAIVKQSDIQYELYRQTADSLYEAGNIDEAFSVYRIAQALKPSDAYAMERLEFISRIRGEEQSLPVDDEGIFIFPDTPARIINGPAVIARIVYPKEAQKNGVEGLVIAKMLVDETGRPSRMSILKGIGSGCDQEALRVLSRAEFEPATFKDEPVKAWHTHPIKFKILE